MAVSKSIDSGTTWTRYSLAAAGYTYALAVDPTNSDIVYAGGDPGVYKTTNGGADWLYISSGLTDFVVDFAIDPLDPTVLYAASRDGVFKTTNSGTNWVNVGCSEANAVVLNPNAPETVYVGTNNGVYKSSTGGGNWTAMNQGLEVFTVTSIGIDPDNYLFAGTDRASMFRWDLNIGIKEYDNKTSERISLWAQPNPAINSTTINYQLTQQTPVTLSIYDVQGRLIKVLVNEKQKSGNHIAFWNGLDDRMNSVASGIYLYKLKTNTITLINKLILLR